MNAQLRIGVIGAGGLGKAAAQMLEQKKEMRLTFICDKHGFACDDAGIPSEQVQQVKREGSVAQLPGGVATDDSIAAVIDHGDQLDGILLALPNLPNEFMPGIVERLFSAGLGAAYVDALKRTRAMDMMLALDDEARAARACYLTGCGATPGLLTAAAVLAAQSFAKVEEVKIWWGVGIANWEEYRATIREDIAHLPGFDVDKAKALTDDEVDELLDRTDGVLELHEMEHADDVLLERAGVIEDRAAVSVGGVMDTRHAKKPVSTTMTLTGVTFDGKRSSHRFILGDDTCMAANVIGPALGYLKRAHWLRQKEIYGVFGSTEFSPCVVK